MTTSLLLWLCLTPSAAPLPARVDLFGDPLPYGAIARMGSVRMRYPSGPRAVVFSPDSKTVISLGDRLDALDFWDVSTGKRVRTITLARTVIESVEVSGDFLAVWGVADRVVRLIDILDGRTGTAIAVVRPPRDVTGLVALSPDRKLALLDAGRDVIAWDVKAAREKYRLSTLGGVGKDRLRCAFLPDGKAFVARWIDYKLHLVSAADGKSIRDLEPDAKDAREVAARVGSVAVTPDGKQVVYRLGRERLVRVVEVATGKEVRKWEDDLEPPSGNPLATDGRRVFWGHEGGVRVWDAKTGKRLRDLPSGTASVRPFALSRDGKTIAQVGRDAILLHDVATGELLHDANHRSWVTEAAFSPDGVRLATASSDGVRIWGAASGKEAGRLARPASSSHLRWDGPSLRWVGGDDLAVHRWKPGDREPAKLTDPKARKLVDHHYDVSGDGKWLALIQPPLTFRVVSLLRPSPARVLAEFAKAPERFNESVVFSPDGRVVAVVAASRKSVRLFDPASGDELHEFRFRGKVGPRASFAPDGRSLLLLDDGQTRLFEVATGGERLSLPQVGNESLHLAKWSPDGRFVAPVREWSATVFDVYTEKQTWQAPGDPVDSPPLAFSDDNRRLATRDRSSVLVWALPTPEKLKSPMDDGQGWRNLGDADAAVGYFALRHFVVSGDASVRWFAKNLSLPAEPGPKQVDRLIAQLDNDVEKYRADAELARLGPAAWPALYKALNHNSPEVRKRAAVLLSRPRFGTPERLRSLRAIEALERIGTPAAKALLEKLLAAKPTADWKEELDATLARLRARGR